MWVAVLFTVLASAGSSIGKVLQKQGTKGLPQLSLSFKVIQAYIASRTWAVGFFLDILGALAMLKAVSEAPVSIVQPVSGCGLAILAVFSHFYLHETMNNLDWIGVLLAGMGTIGVGIAGEQQNSSDVHASRLIWFLLWAFLLFMLSRWRKLIRYLVMVGFISNDKGDRVVVKIERQSKQYWNGGALDRWAHVQRGSSRAHDHANSVLPPVSIVSHGGVLEEVVAGMEAGTCFGVAAVVSRLGFMLVEKGHSPLCVPGGILGGVVCSASGFFCQTKGLKEGRAVIISTCAAVASIVTGVLVGMLALGETVPVSRLRRTCLFIGWLFIIFGVVILMDSHRVSRLLPRSVRRLLKLKGSSHKSLS